MFRWAAFVILGIALLAGGCTTPPSLSDKYSISRVQPRGKILTTSVMLVADNQLNHMFGDPTPLITEFNDKVVRVTLRPVAQDIFAPHVLRWSLENFRYGEKVIHLGDGLNTACVGEFKRFVDVMTPGPSVSAHRKWKWVMAPGNHDAYYLGNTQNSPGMWRDACKRADGPLTKDRFVRSYLEQLQRQFDEFRKDYPGTLPDSGQWRPGSHKGHFLRAVAWKIDKDAPHRSFVVQELNLARDSSDRPISAILLDTSQYHWAPALVPFLFSPNAGINGDLVSDQVSFIRQWLEDDSDNNKISLLLGHHPYDTLRSSAKSAIDALRQDYRVVLYVSAHTHKGQYYVHGAPDGKTWLELNVGSITDWPVEFRVLNIGTVEHDPSKLSMRVPLFRLPDSAKKFNTWPRDCAAWIPKPGDPDSFIALEQRKTTSAKQTYRNRMVDALWLYRRFIEKIPTAKNGAQQPWPPGHASDTTLLAHMEKLQTTGSVEEQRTFILDLVRFDRGRTVENEKNRRDYRLCQAVEASKYDKLRSIKPIVEDQYIIIPGS